MIFLFLALKIPRIENVDVYNNRCIWQHVITVGVFSELHSQESFVGHILLSHVRMVGKVNYWLRQHSHS
jgi:hypothetical protein